MEGCPVKQRMADQGESRGAWCGTLSDLGDVNRVLTVEVDLCGGECGGDFLSANCCLDSMVGTWCLPSSLCETLSLLPAP